jgi:hypothetical protein
MSSIWLRILASSPGGWSLWRLVELELELGLVAAELLDPFLERGQASADVVVLVVEGALLEGGQVAVYAGTHAAALRSHGLDRDALNLVQLLERHELHREVLLMAYRAWRRHRPASLDPRIRHLLPAPYDPTSGRLTLTADDEDAWLVTPDPAAATGYGAPRLAGRTIGEITPTHQGWQPTAFSLNHHGGQAIRQHAYRLPPVDDEAAACRSLLRWWALYNQPTWDGRTPAQLTAAEQDALSA